MLWEVEVELGVVGVGVVEVGVVGRQEWWILSTIIAPKKPNPCCKN